MLEQIASNLYQIRSNSVDDFLIEILENSFQAFVRQL